jgi:hypothetical protein
MGFNSTNRLPYIRSYATAKGTYERVAPIRGDENNRRPLAKRSDKYMHISKVQKNADEVYICHCYDKPMVTYYPDDTVEINEAPHCTAYTREFYGQLLSGMRVYVINSKTVMQLKGSKDKYVIAKGNTIRLKHDYIKNTWEVVQAEGALEWTLNKAKANIVRRPYAEFLGYYKGMTSLLNEAVDFDVKYARHYNKPDADTPFITKHEVVLPMPTLVSMFGVNTTTFGGETLNTTEIDKASNTWVPHWGDKDKCAELIGNTKAKQQEVLALMRSDQPEDTKSDNFYKAALMMLMQGMSYVSVKKDTVKIATSTARKKADEFILRMHKDEVLEEKRMPMGKVSSTNYHTWFEYI